MIKTLGNNIVNAFTGGNPVKAIYTYGEKVWPTSGPEPTEYYIKWTPSDISGIFTIGGEARFLQSYNGYYNGPFSSRNVDESGVVVPYYYIDKGAFVSTSILTIDTNIRYVSSFAFQGCSSLQTVRMPGRYVLNGVFRDCTELQTISLPEMKNLHPFTFNECTKLRYVYLPNVTFIGPDYAAFSNCVNLLSVSLPKCRAIDDYGMASCGIYEISLPEISMLNGYAFYSCSNLSTIYLGNTIPTLKEGVFQGTKITSSTGSIYVPISKLLAYKSASGWKYYSNRIFPIQS